MGTLLKIIILVLALVICLRLYDYLENEHKYIDELEWFYGTMHFSTLKSGCLELEQNSFDITLDDTNNNLDFSFSFRNMCKNESEKPELVGIHFSVTNATDEPIVELYQWFNKGENFEEAFDYKETANTLWINTSKLEDYGTYNVKLSFPLLDKTYKYYSLGSATSMKEGSPIRFLYNRGDYSCGESCFSVISGVPIKDFKISKKSDKLDIKRYETDGKGLLFIFNPPKTKILILQKVLEAIMLGIVAGGVYNFLANKKF